MAGFNWGAALQSGGQGLSGYAQMQMEEKWRQAEIKRMQDEQLRREAVAQAEQLRRERVAQEAQQAAWDREDILDPVVPLKPDVADFYGYRGQSIPASPYGGGGGVPVMRRESSMLDLVGGMPKDEKTFLDEKIVQLPLPGGGTGQFIRNPNTGDLTPYTPTKTSGGGVPGDIESKRVQDTLTTMYGGRRTNTSGTWVNRVDAKGRPLTGPDGQILKEFIPGAFEESVRGEVLDIARLDPELAPKIIAAATRILKDNPALTIYEAGAKAEEMYAEEIRAAQANEQAVGNVYGWLAEEGISWNDQKGEWDHNILKDDGALFGKNDQDYTHDELAVWIRGKTGATTVTVPEARAFLKSIGVTNIDAYLGDPEQNPPIVDQEVRANQEAGGDKKVAAMLAAAKTEGIAVDKHYYENGKLFIESGGRKIEWED